MIELWGLGREGEAARALVAEFERRNPDVRVEVQQVPWSAAHEKLLTAFVGEAMPDVFQTGNTWIPELAAIGAVEPLDARASSSATIDLDDWFPGFLEASRADGVLYGIPWYVDTRLLFYRPDLLAAAGFATPPRTWDEWRRALTAVAALGDERRHGMLLSLHEWHPIVILALQRGATLLRDEGTRGDFRSEAFRDAFTFYVSLFESGLAPVSGATQVASVHRDFARGAFAFHWTGPWDLGDFRARVPADVPWATAPCPAPDGSGPGVSTAGGASLAIHRGSARKEAAWRLVEFLSEAESQRELYRRTGDLPARRSAWEDGGPAGDEEAAAFRVQLEHVRATPAVPEWERIAAAIVRRAESAVRGRATIDEALASLDRDADAILEKRRWMIARAAEVERR